MNAAVIPRLQAESILYDWACGKVTTARAKRLCQSLCFQIDFRQADKGNWLDAYYRCNPVAIRLYV
jgi:hypothetical protein